MDRNTFTYILPHPGRILFSILFISGLLLCSSNRILAADCTETVSDNDAIQTAIDNGAAGDVICISQGTYQLNLVMKADITLQGAELGRTILENNSTSPIISVADNVTVQNVTIRNQDGDTGINAEDVIGVTVTNVIIDTMNTGLNCDNSEVTVSHVVFHANSTAITGSNNSALTIQNSIISASTDQDINFTVSTSLTLNNNLLFNNLTRSYPNDATSVFDEDPLFVDPDNNDFHLKTGSPAIGAGSGLDTDGSPADIGAYGGENADVAPFPVSGLTGTTQGQGSISLSWSANNAFNIARYNLYFDVDAAGEPYNGIAAEGNSPVSVVQTTQQLTALAFPAPILAAPTGLVTMPGNQTLLISWSAVNNATGYQLSYGTTSGNYSTTVDIGNDTFHQITSLTNDVEIFITVAAYFNPTVYAVVTAVDNNNNESALAGEIEVLLTDNQTIGLLSSEVSDTPEEGVVFPNLKDEYSCFIATTAYDSNLEQQGNVLRKISNHYLLNNDMGNGVVALYALVIFALSRLNKNHGVAVFSCLMIFASLITRKRMRRMKS